MKQATFLLLIAFCLSCSNNNSSEPIGYRGLNLEESRSVVSQKLDSLERMGEIYDVHTWHMGDLEESDENYTIANVIAGYGPLIYFKIKKISILEHLTYCVLQFNERTDCLYAIFASTRKADTDERSAIESIFSERYGKPKTGAFSSRCGRTFWSDGNTFLADIFSNKVEERIKYYGKTKQWNAGKNEIWCIDKYVDKKVYSYDPGEFYRQYRSIKYLFEKDNSYTSEMLMAGDLIHDSLIPETSKYQADAEDVYIVCYVSRVQDKIIRDFVKEQDAAYDKRKEEEKNQRSKELNQIY